MSSRVLKQQLSALTRQKGPDTELGPKKKELKSRRKAKSSKAKATSIAPAQEQADQAQAPFAKDKEETLRRNLEYLAAQKNSDHAARSLAKMQQVTQMHCRAHCKSCMSPASKGVSPSVCACSCTSSPPPPPPPRAGMSSGETVAMAFSGLNMQPAMMHWCCCDMGWLHINAAYMLLPPDSYIHVSC